MAWVCPLCSTANEDAAAECMVCGQARASIDLSSSGGDGREPWICPLCSTSNAAGAVTCIVCDTTRPAETSSGVVTLTKKRVSSLGLTGEVVIPDKFNVIGAGAFAGRRDITGVVLHPGVKKIAKEAFLGCTSLAYVRADHELDSVGSNAFGGCVALSEGRDIRARHMAIDAFFAPGESASTITSGSAAGRSWGAAFAAADGEAEDTRPASTSWGAAFASAAESDAPAGGSHESAAARLAREIAASRGSSSGSSSTRRASTGGGTGSSASSGASPRRTSPTVDGATAPRSTHTAPTVGGATAPRSTHTAPTVSGATAPRSTHTAPTVGDTAASDTTAPVSAYPRPVGLVLKIFRTALMILLGAAMTVVAAFFTAFCGWQSPLLIWIPALTVGFMAAASVYLLWKRLREESGSPNITFFHTVEALLIELLLLAVAIVFQGIPALVSLGGGALLLVAHVIIYIRETRNCLSTWAFVSVHPAIAGFLAVISSLLIYFVGR